MAIGGGRGMGLGRMYYGDKAEITPQTWQNFKRISRYFLKYWPQMLLLVFCVAASSAIGLIPTLLVRQIVDVALPKRDLVLLAWLSIGSLGANGLSGLMSVIITYLSSLVGYRVVYNIRTQMYKHLQQLPLKFFSNVSTGEVLSRLNNDVSGIESVSVNTFVNLLTNIFQVMFIAVTLFTMNWKMALLGIGMIPLFVIPTRLVGKVRWRIASKTQEKYADISSFIQEHLGISGVILSKVFVRQDEETRQFSEKSKQLAELQIREGLVGRWFFMAVRIFSSIGPALIYWYGGYLLTKETLSLGTIIAFVTFLNQLYGPVTQLSNTQVDVTRSMALFDRIFEYLDIPVEEPVKDKLIKMPPIKGHIKYNHVYFSYEPGRPVLQDIDFEVLPGQLTALVGPSGAGKTTITYLLPRLYDPDSGNIEIDGINTRLVTMDSLRRQIGVVTQDIFLFNSTIRENLLYGKPDATQEEIEAACKAAYIHDLIMSLPKQYDTVVGERGIKLSGGEKQRLAIARVILKDPRILILDEATSSLDSQSESLIQKAIEPLLKQRTSIVIAHRLSTILAADQILVIEHGKIIERGTHAELLKQNGLYTKLYNEQFKIKNHAAS